MQPMLITAIKAARRGATIINRASFDLGQLKVTEKKHNDYVTEIDQAAERAIVEVLQKAYPTHAVLAEESGASDNLHDESEYVWIIDPLDGTTNFIHGFPQYCVSIALQQRGVTTQAVIYDPNRNDLFVASKGEGAFLNDKRLRVSKCDKLADSLIGTGFPARDLSKLDEYMTMFKLITEKCQGLRRPGSAALDLAYVAAGRLDGFFEKGLSAWDMAAGALLISEAGGIIGDFKGEQTYMEQGDVIAGNPRIFYQMISLLGQYA
ncbi:MAG: inositol monophosphatase family protein [Burkholderiaceae bacterium]|nr:inositol monophosphatase family protein [Burkholderiaceae bacterium]